MDGFYSIYFSGAAGVGFGLLALRQGAITGADAAGASYDGRYSVTEAGIQGEVTLNAPPGVQLVTGAAAGAAGQAWRIPLNLPRDFANGQAHLVNTPTGKVNVVFRKLRDFA